MELPYWDTLIVTLLTTLFSRHPFFGQLGLVYNVDQLKYTRHPTCLESSLSSVTSAKYLTLYNSNYQILRYRKLGFKIHRDHVSLSIEEFELV